jgi:hypothetical protein
MAASEPVVELVFCGRTFPVSRLALANTCEIFRGDPVPLSYSVRSAVSAASFGAFLAAVCGSPFEITPDNVSELDLLCGEFASPGL